MKTKQRNLFVALILSVAIFFGTFGALSLTNVNKASALSSVTADATLTDFEPVNGKAKIVENEGAAVTANDAYPVYFVPIKEYSITDRVEISMDVYKFSCFTFYFRSGAYYRPGTTGLHLFSYKNGNLCFTRSASGWVFYEDKISIEGNEFIFGGFDKDGNPVYSVSGDGNPVGGVAAGYNVENGFNIKATIYSQAYTSNFASAKNIVKFDIAPFDENGDVIEERKLTYYSWGTSGIDITKTYYVGATFLGDNGVTVVDNFKITNYNGNEKNIIIDNTFDTFVGTTFIPTADVPFIGVKAQAGKREITNEIFNNADGIVSKTAINDRQYIIDGEMTISQLDIGKKMGLLLGMDNKIDNVGADGTTYAYFTNKADGSYFGVNGKEEKLNNAIDGEVNYKLQVNNDGSIIAVVNDQQMFFKTTGKVKGYIAYKSNGAGVVQANIDATTIETFNVEGVMSEGASIRLGELTNSGMRFETTFTKETVDALINKYGEDNVKFGTIITRADFPYNVEEGSYSVDVNTITIEELSAKNVWYVDIESQMNAGAEDLIYCGSLRNIKNTNYGKEFIGRGYVKVTLDENNVIYFYADFFEGNVENNKRSVKYVAEEFMNDPESWYDDYAASVSEADNVILTYIGNSNNVG